jgi:hypothetical protein
MALSRFVVTARVTLTTDTLATVVAGEPGTGGAAGFGNAAVSAGAAVFPVALQAGTAIVLDSASPSTRT